MSEVVLKRFIDSIPDAFREGDANAEAKTAEAENVRRLQDMFRAIVRGDLDAAVEAMADDIQMEIVAPAEFGFICRAQGRAKVLEAMQNNFAQVEDQRPEMLGLVAQGDTLVAIARERGRHRPSGRPYQVHWVQQYQFRDGKITSFREYTAGTELSTG